MPVADLPGAPIGVARLAVGDLRLPAGLGQRARLRDVTLRTHASLRDVGGDGERASDQQQQRPHPDAGGKKEAANRFPCCRAEWSHAVAIAVRRSFRY